MTGTQNCRSPSSARTATAVAKAAPTGLLGAAFTSGGSAAAALYMGERWVLLFAWVLCALPVILADFLGGERR